MAKQYIKDLKVGDYVNSEFSYGQAVVRQGKNLSYFARAVLADKTGTIPAIYWDYPHEQASDLLDSQYMTLQGQVSLDNQNPPSPQIVITEFESSDKPQGLLSDLFPASPIPLEKLQLRLDFFINSVKLAPLKELLVSMFVHNTVLREQYESTQAAKSMHHAYIHGLFEHSLEVTDLVYKIVQQQVFWRLSPRRPLFQDLLVTAALLHDIGKIEELLMGAYSVVGTQLGHVHLGLVLIERHISELRERGVDFTKDLEQQLNHLILSHHGEYGDQQATIPEAEILHFADSLSARNDYYKQAENEYMSLGMTGVKAIRQYKLDGPSKKTRLVIVGMIESIMEYYGIS